MKNYAPIFNSIVDSSLWEEPLHVRITFVTMMALKDADHVVRVKDHHLRRKANVTDQELIDALKVLSEPDRRTSITQDFDGRRIKRVEDGWLVLNGEKYQEMMRVSNQRARWARQKQAQRERQKCHPLPGERAYEEALRSGDDKRAQDILDGQAESGPT